MRFPPASDIRRLRKGLDLTQTDLARDSRVSQSTIAKIESGRMSTSYETMVCLFNTLESIRQKKMKNITAVDVASKSIVSVQSTEKVSVATNLMFSSGFSQLPVLNGEVPVGSISEKRLFKVMREKDIEDLKDLPVSSIMGDSFPTVTENTPLDSIIAMMDSCDAIIVSKNGKMTGLITNADMIKLI